WSGRMAGGPFSCHASIHGGISAMVGSDDCDWPGKRISRDLYRAPLFGRRRIVRVSVLLANFCKRDHAGSSWARECAIGCGLKTWASLRDIYRRHDTGTRRLAIFLHCVGRGQSALADSMATVCEKAGGLAGKP